MQRAYTLDTIKNIGQEVLVKGWIAARRDHGKLIFLDIRDMTGLLQIVVNPKVAPEAHKTAESLRSEFVVEITGKINERPKNLINPHLPTGTVELEATAIIILNEAKTLPFELDKTSEINEELRLRYRYLDIRTERMQKNLKLRHQIALQMRNWLSSRGFTEVETPILTKSTPEGARDFLVPSRLHPGKFYALPQSPQQYKQLLMVAGLEKYFQIPRCFRDEDPRGDRQPEFTQLDLEMSFISQEEILSLIEELYIDLVKTLAPQKKISQIPFPRITYKAAMDKYGSDKPDLRKDKNDPQELAFAFIVDFPMFEWKEQEKRWDAVHHPFTRPQVQGHLPSFINQMKKEPGKILAHQYDFVLNGYEIGGGSIRIHEPELLEAVFEIMGHTKENIRQRFGHMLEAFEYGVPPHGGIAPGLDRFVMILAGEPNIREVIAFPKTGDAYDPLMNSPDSVEPQQLKELHIKTDANQNRQV